MGGRGRRDSSLRRRRDFRRRARAHGERGLRHLPPSCGGAAAPDVAAPVRAGAVPRSDARLQGRGDAADLAADGPCARKARPAHHHRGRDVRRYRRCRGRSFCGARERRSHRAVSAWPHLRGAAADDDDDGRGQRPCARHRGYLRRLPGAREGDVQQPPLPRCDLALRRQFDQLGAHRRPGGLLFHLRRRGRRAGARGRFRRSDRQFRRYLRRLRRQAHGAAGAHPAHRRQRQRHSGAHAEDRHLRGARGARDGIAVNGHPDLLELRTAAVRGRPARCRRRSPLDGVLEAVRALRAARCDARRDSRGVRCRARRRDRDCSCDPRRLARSRRAGRSPYRRGARGRGPRHHRYEGAEHRALDRASGQIPRRRRGGLRPAAAIAGLARRPDDQIRTHEGDEERSGRGRAVRAVRQPRRKAGSCRMSVEMSKLASGLTVVTDEMPHLETAALGVWAGVGGRDEKPNEHGISHLLEHMAFKGTTKRSSREIVEEIEAVGGDLNAGTSTETTSYYARVLKADVPLALDVLADILANPAFEPDELEREKNVIVQEIGAAQDTPDDVVFEHLNELCYPDQPMGRSLLGTAKTLRAFNRDMLRGYLSTHYRGPDMVVAAAGAVNHAQVVAEVEKRFASFEGTPGPKPQAAMFGKGGTKVVHRELEQAHLTLALEGVPQNDLSLFSLQVFTNILGGGMSSRLFQEVREKRGLCYSIYTFHAPYSDTGFFGLYTGTDPADAPEMMEVVVDIMNDSVETLTEAEIARAKAQMKAGLLMALESCSSRAEQLARHVLAYGRPQTVQELVARIDAVSIESTRDAARALLSRSRPAVVALGSGRGLDTAVSFAEGLTRARAKARLH
nr:hypothetical zinc protease RC0293 [Bradyrhizobium sp. DOA9]